MKYRFPIGILIGLLFTLAVYGQKAEFTASAPASVRVGQQFQYTVSGNQRGEVSLPAMENFDLLSGPYTSFQSSTQWINGKMEAQTLASYTYILRVNKPGEYVIEPAEVKVRKTSYTTNSVSISALEGSAPATNQNNSQAKAVSSNAGTADQPSSESPVYLRVLPSRRSVYVGEQLVSELKVYTSVNTRPSAGLKEVPYEGFYKHALEADQNSIRENINGKVHVTQVLQRHVIIPQKSGKLVIEPFTSEWTLPKRVSRSNNIYDDFFNDPFFDRVQEVPTQISTKAVTINVKPLPSGAPAGFTGAVGDLKMTASLSATEATVNDALSLKISISGVGNISLIGEPKVDFPPDHDLYETTKSLNISTSGNRVSGSVSFEYPIVVRHAGSFRIAPISFSWFDPSEEKYKTIVTDEFNFTVQKAEGNEEQSQVFVPGLRAEEVQNIGTDILDIIRRVPDFQKRDNSLLSKPFYWLIYLILLLLAAAMVIILRISYKQRADVRLRRNKQASKLARSRMKVADKARKAGDADSFFEETEKAIWGYLGDKLNIDLSSLSKEKVTDVLGNSGIEEVTLTKISSLIEDCEFSRYAPSGEKNDMDRLFNESLLLIQELEQMIRTR